MSVLCKWYITSIYIHINGGCSIARLDYHMLGWHFFHHLHDLPNGLRRSDLRPFLPSSCLCLSPNDRPITSSSCRLSLLKTSWNLRIKWAWWDPQEMCDQQAMHLSILWYDSLSLSLCLSLSPSPSYHIYSYFILFTGFTTVMAFFGHQPARPFLSLPPFPFPFRPLAPSPVPCLSLLRTYQSTIWACYWITW